MSDFSIADGINRIARGGRVDGNESFACAELFRYGGIVGVAIGVEFQIGIGEITIIFRERHGEDGGGSAGERRFSGAVQRIEKFALIGVIDGFAVVGEGGDMVIVVQRLERVVFRFAECFERLRVDGNGAAGGDGVIQSVVGDFERAAGTHTRKTCRFEILREHEKFRRLRGEEQAFAVIEANLRDFLIGSGAVIVLRIFFCEAAVNVDG